MHWSCNLFESVRSIFSCNTMIYIYIAGEDITADFSGSSRMQLCDRLRPPLFTAVYAKV